MVTPGSFTAELHQSENGMLTKVAGPVSITVKRLKEGALPAKPTEEIDAFRTSFQNFSQDLMATASALKEGKALAAAMKRAYAEVKTPNNALLMKINAAQKALRAIDATMNGNPAKNEIGERNPPTPGDGSFIGYVALSNTYGPTGNQLKAFTRAKSQLRAVKAELSTLVNSTLPALEAELKAAGAPWIEGQGLLKN